MFNPFFTWLSPVLLYVVFHYTAFSVRVFYQTQISSGAQSSDDDTSYLIFIFTNLVFIGAINSSYGYFMINQVDHSCGAFLGEQYVINTIYNRTTLVSK
jgi:hypothetical protein